MKKLKLELDTLHVDSFQTSWGDMRIGTVNGEQEKLSGGGPTQCGGAHTCGDGCRGAVSAGPVTQCGGVQTCGGGGGAVSAGPVTQCGGVETCGGGAAVSAGPVTQCGGVQTCGDCK